jgi:hypothetical protein
MRTATKKFAHATLSAPVMAALAIGLAGSAAAAPAGPQPSDTITADDPYTISVPIKLTINMDRKAFTYATNLVSINFPRVDPIGDGVWGQTNSPKLGTAARPAGPTTRGASGAAGIAPKGINLEQGTRLKSINENHTPIRPKKGGDGVVIISNPFGTR